MYYTYLLRCTDGSLYCGIASDLARRMKEHFSADAKCAKYTRTHPPKVLAAAWESADRSSASRLEYRLKQLPKAKKELLAMGEPLIQILDDPGFCSFYRALESGERCCE